MKIVIVDDEKYFLKKLKIMVKNEFESLNIECNIDTYSDENLFFDNFSDDYDILFFDIELTEINGIDIAKKLRLKGYNGFIIFVTSHINYSVLGYEVEAFRYILKADIDILLPECIKSIVKKISFNFFEIDSKNKIKVQNIIYIESNKHRLNFITNEEQSSNYTIYDKLDNIEKKFDAFNFLRIHKSYLVNVKYIVKIKKYKIVLVDGMILPISRSKYKNTEKQLFMRRYT